MNVNKVSFSFVASAACAVAMTLATAATATAQNLIASPDYSNLSDWTGYDGGGVNPSTFVTVSSGVATVTPINSNECDFYQQFGGGAQPALTLGTPYSFTIESSNSSLNAGTTTAVAFVKAFTSGYGWIGGEFQEVALPFDGSTTTINFTPVAGVIYQLGTLTTGTTSGSYDLTSPSLEVVPEPTTIALAGLGAAALLIFRRRS